jgi:hypothetical protein
MIGFLLKRLVIFVFLFTSLFSNLVSVSALDFVVPTPQLKELFTGHNDTTIRRVNLVFVFLDSYYNEDNLEQSITNLKDSLTFNGEPIRIKNEQGETVDLKYGMFAVEPLRSYRNKFNLWVYEDVHTYQVEVPKFVRGLRDTVIIYADSENDYQRGSAGGQIALSESQFNPENPPYILLNYSFSKPVDNFFINTITHEFGHLVGFDDEYVEYKNEEEQNWLLSKYDELETNLFYLWNPDLLSEAYNCTLSQEVATQTWGDLVGQTDPFLEKIENDYKTLVTGENQNINIDYEARRIQLNAKGCTGNQMYVPATTSIMRGNLEIPAFNPVERRLIDEVMAVFESSPKEGYSKLPILEQSQEIEKESVTEYKRWRSRLGVREKGNEKIDNSVADYNWFWVAGFGGLVLIVLIIIVVFAVFKK